MRWSRTAATCKDFHTRNLLRSCSAAVEPSLTPASCKHSFPSPSRKPPTSLPPRERVCRQRYRRRFISPPSLLTSHLFEIVRSWITFTEAIRLCLDLPFQQRDLASYGYP